MQFEFARRTRCGVCGFAEVRTDEVVDQGPVFLAECPRCDHRWISPRPATLKPQATVSAAAMPQATVSAEAMPQATVSAEAAVRVRAVRPFPFREVVSAA
jgi:hypothetical protein